jgi:hypothetical protein
LGADRRGDVVPVGRLLALVRGKVTIQHRIELQNLHAADIIRFGNFWLKVQNKQSQASPLDRKMTYYTRNYRKLTYYTRKSPRIRKLRPWTTKNIIWRAATATLLPCATRAGLV